ncbi:hypothetical protein Syun_029901 [Stephania yunnanensis]|uniref:Integrase catalytic domain-containing protein n=1 Tax=Stephania yunnanensis TaxID=152371 RepID=A0AAP0HJZ7_9MAGN
MDIWGPYKQSSIQGAHYFWTIVDDFSRFTWTFFMKHKSLTGNIIKQFIVFIQTLFKVSVQTIMTDNGTEFCNKDCHALFSGLGIVHQRSTPYTPQQNGVVERKHRHLLQVTRALIFQSNLSTKFWGDAVLTPTYIINRLLSQLLKWKSPYCLLFGRIPNYSSLKTFGCLCFATNVSPSKSKLDSRAIKCFFISYSPGQKAYRLYNMATHTCFVSRDVIFFEKQFPFHKDTASSRCHVPISFGDNSDYLRDIPTPIAPTSATVPPSQDLPINETCFDVPEAVSSVPTNDALVPHTNDDLHEDVLPPTAVVTRKSTRAVHKPLWPNDFVLNNVEASFFPYTIIPLSTGNPPTFPFIHSPNITASYKCFLAVVSNIKEPTSYIQAQYDPVWVEAMNKELQALETNGTWSLTTLPPGKKAIGSKWIYKVKLHPDGSLDRCKACLVAKGFNQIEGVDYTDSFSPVAKNVTVRIVLSLAVARDWPLHQLDVNNAFLHGYIDEDVYMKPPDGYNLASPNQVRKLQRSLYGLKQASRQWNHELTTKLQSFGFNQSTHDPCLFTYNTAGQFLVLLVYVDDVLLTGTSLELIDQVKTFLHTLFTIKDLGQARYFLGLELVRSSSGLYVHQRKYVLDLLNDAGLLMAKPAATPLPRDCKFIDPDSPLLIEVDRYRRLVGRLLYLRFTRPDITYATQQLSQYVQAPTEQHWSGALHVLRYLKGTPSQGLFFPVQQDLSVVAYCDSDWAACPLSRKSITGYCVFMGSSLVS